MRISLLTGFACLLLGCADHTPRRAELLFLGQGQEASGKYASWLAIRMFPKGVNLSYTDSLAGGQLDPYDGLILNLPFDSLSGDAGRELQRFVKKGKALIVFQEEGKDQGPDWFVSAMAEASAGTASAVGSATAGSSGAGAPGRAALGKGRIFAPSYRHSDSAWKSLTFLDQAEEGILWALGPQVQERIAALGIPRADIYNSDTIADYTRRYDVPGMQEALSPEESMKLIQVPVDFRLELFAAEPDITNPIAMAWDERGRLWIVESVDYPNTFVETDGQANDRIKICEDTDGDGKADKFTVFADSLNIPTSIVFARGGVIVAQAPHFIFMKDTDGDDRADVREIILSGWGKSDTHAGPSNLLYGFDNKIWGVLGYSGFEGNVNGEYLQSGQGVYRFEPDGSRLEFLAGTSNNTWGLGFTEDNNVFISTANNTHSAFYSMPARFMARVLPGEERPDPVQKLDGHYDAHALTPNLRQVDVLGGFTAAAGHHFYTARNFPREYWNRIAFVTEPTVRLVHNAIIEPDGAGFKEADGWNLMAGSDEWFGPVQAQVGPDGAVWVADWYNFIIQHNVFVPAQAPSEKVLPFTEQPHGQGNAFESPLRDVNHGRIYRVVYKKAKKPSWKALSADDPEASLQALKSDNMFWRMTAQRLLVESGDRSLKDGLISIADDRRTDELGLNAPAIHALWTLHGLGLLDGADETALDAAIRALEHPSAAVRKAAVQVLPRTGQAVEKSAAAILESGLLLDPDRNTRMAAYVALADFPPLKEVGQALYQASLDTAAARDRWLPAALFAAASAHSAGFLEGGERAGETGLASRIRDGLENELYRFGGRSRLPVDVRGKSIRVSATVSRRRDQPLHGLILAHGDAENGYGLFVREGRLHMVVNQEGARYEAVSRGSLPERFGLNAGVDQEGRIRITVDGREVAAAKAPGVFTTPLSLPLRTGRDPGEGGKIADYEGAFDFSGNLQDLSLSLSASPGSAGGEAPAGEALIVNLGVVLDLMQYDTKLITVRAGQRVIIEFSNTDAMQHNFLLIKPGTLEKVGAAADELARNPRKTVKPYVPEIPEVLYATDLLDPGQTTSVEFQAPEQAGDYPYVCTFPGHWRGMNGILRVVAD